MYVHCGIWMYRKIECSTQVSGKTLYSNPRSGRSRRLLRSLMPIPQKLVKLLRNIHYSNDMLSSIQSYTANKLERSKDSERAPENWLRSNKCLIDIHFPLGNNKRIHRKIKGVTTGAMKDSTFYLFFFYLFMCSFSLYIAHRMLRTNYCEIINVKQPPCAWIDDRGLADLDT